MCAFLVVLSTLIVVPRLGVSLARASTGQSWNFRDEFNYTSISQLQSAGWSLNPSPNVPASYYGFQNSTLTLYSNGVDNSAFVRRSDVPANVSDWSVSARGKVIGGLSSPGYGRIQLLVPTSKHTYVLEADGSSNSLILIMDGQQVASFPGYTPQANVWHILQLDMVSGTLYPFFDGTLLGNYTDPDRTTGNTDLAALELTAAPFVTNGFDWIQASNSPSPETPYFKIDANPVSIQLSLGQSGNSTIQISGYIGFAGSVNLATTEPSPGPTVQISPATIVVLKGGSANATLSAVAVNSKISTSYPVNVTATSGSLSKSIIVDVVVTPAHAPIVIGGNSAFAPASGVIGGSGTASDPYVISGWSIDVWNYPYLVNGYEQFPTYGIEIANTTAYFVIENVQVGGVADSVGFINVSNGAIERSSISTHYQNPLWIGSSSNILVKSNNIGGGGNCVSPSTCSIYDAIDALSDNGLTILNNTIGGEIGNGAGIYGSSNVTVTDNTFQQSNSWNTGSSGLLLDGSTNVVVSGNSFSQNGLTVQGTRDQLSSYTITSDNLADGMPVYYFKDCSGLNVDGVSLGQLIIADCTNVTVTDLNLPSDYAPLQLQYVTSALITHDIIASSWFAYGGLVYGSASVVVSYNNFSSTNNQYYYSTGLELVESTNSTIFGNNFVNNHLGLEVSSNQTRVFHNNFIFNTDCCTAASDQGSLNTWDNGYPSGGNYWSDYAGSDPDHDGIGDTPYPVCCNGVADRYPLVNPYGSNSNGGPNGGVTLPVDRLELAAPYLVLGLVGSVAVVLVLYARRSRRRDSRSLMA